MNRIGMISALMLSAQCFSCGGSGISDGENVAATEQAIHQEGWMGPYQNQMTGPHPVVVRQPDGNIVYVCEVPEADGRYHPGKLWQGTCRYDYGGAIKYAGTYYTLDINTPAGASWNSLGSVPNNAYESGAPQDPNAPAQPSSPLPVCLSGGAIRGIPGLYWSGTCRFEYGGSRHETSVFWYLCAGSTCTTTP